ncbi:NEW3 domain-containing protein [Nonomuraea longicatena]|uniref:Alpha-galactosidase NEW3 domain-containing protein n=1 Tax=Nonomuraea longicatena TaxID=83682 RepID=A0ABN1QKJ5_9ACTN
MRLRVLCFGARVPLEAEHASRSRGVRVEPCRACSGSAQVTGGEVTYRDVTVAEAGTYRLQLDHTGPSRVSVNGGAPVGVPGAAVRPDVPAVSALAVPLAAGANTIRIAAEGAGLDRISVGPMPPAASVPATTLTVEPGGLQWVGRGQQSIKVAASLRLDVDDQLDQVRLAPTAPQGWTVEGEAATATSLRIGRTLTATWTLTSPPGQDPAADVPITAAFQVLGREARTVKQFRVRQRPADRLFVREAEDTANRLGSSGVTGCGACSGGQKVRNIGGEPEAYVLFENVVVPQGPYTLVADFTVNGPRSFFATVNDAAPVEVRVDGVGNNRPYIVELPVTLRAGANTIKIHNDTEVAPDLDRLSIGPAASVSDRKS